MNKIIWFASSNSNKVLELENFFQPYGYKIKSLLDLDQPLNIIENGSSYEENALIKAKALSNYLINQKNDSDTIVIGDDTGLEIVALENFPGIFSERWKGDMSFYQAMEVILKKLENKKNRKAKMVTAIVCIDNKNKITKTFIGQLNGKIAAAISATQGFGYDSFFYLPNKKVTLSEISKAEKNEISHRGLALKQLLVYLNETQIN
ncbi:RdgB/HAM1 family non-canonical purine NTP pyrophosphatase [Spiroplasma platyhelix]|uniref:dITP/XTP pyrophosphatase n=1 Tax=Spiroplasma platyhelix PALS-1 TaxID=1276218 RepID=A0A846TS66_9MOLU|nr:RdgB/HAM1 family non-canonical purine NTP pyrophosphatase [Spiroplasma platyhelix]MBE4703972.1 dITP/XTP pyrophosphatase [Spiroplasma platyhelix PALS-1]NKE38345.1 RdgB/HAM1 family non-canonical purine NTP pyrophosphatase [Spiroplasma platyhelix PALS-1]UJB29230.1 XTP/dITP diphosphohydrolase [Spiroplasma platyhelix PALS-1]